MKLIPFPEQTVVIAKDQPEYQPLPAFQFAHDPTGRIACCWQLTFRERLKLLFTGRLWHIIMAFHQPLQPQLLQLEKPFTPADVKLATETAKESDQRRAFEKRMVEKYGEATRKKMEHMDALNYHPNARRRVVKFDPEDFAQAKTYGLLFLARARIVNADKQTAVPD